MSTHDCTNIDTTGSERGARIHAMEKLRSPMSCLRRWRRAAQASALGVATALSALTATPAVAGVINNWQFGLDVFCDQTLHEVSITPAAFSSPPTLADSGYRIWWQSENGGWSGPTEWKVFYNRTGYWDGPRPIFTGSGLYQFYVEYALYTTTGWVTYAEFANHRVSIGGFTNSGGATYCYA